MYKQAINHISGVICGVTREKEDGGTLFIPFAPDNTDYQAYLKWLKEGNQPLPADENA